MKNSRSINAEQLNRSFHRFSDYSRDVVNADMNTFQDRIDVLMSYCESDAIFSTIHRQLVADDSAKFEEWLDERKATARGMVGSGELKFPKNQIDRIKTQYWLLRQVYADNLDVVDFSHSFFATRSNSVNDQISFFTNTILDPLVRELAYRVDDMVLARLPNSTDTMDLYEFDIFPDTELTRDDESVLSKSLDVKTDVPSISTTNFSSSLRFNALSVITSAREYRELVRGNNKIAADHPEEREKLLEFLTYVEKAADELDQIVPDDDSTGLPSDNIEVQSWMNRFWDQSRSEFSEIFAPEKMSGLVVPASLVLGLGAIGGIIGGPAGFGVGSLAGQFISGHVKAGRLSDEIGKGLQE